MSKAVIVEDYNPLWPEYFAQLKHAIWPLVSDFATGIEHVGSTSVPGLSAKPIIDIDIIIDSRARLPLVAERLGILGYQHRGDLGIEGREAFAGGPNLIAHNLYVCLKNSVALKNHLILRDRLRVDARARSNYGALKKELATKFPNSIDDYIDGKTAFILKMLADDIGQEQLSAIEEANRKKL